MAAKASCSVCGRERTSAYCKCPWQLPFEKWPGALLSKLKQLVPAGPQTGS